MDYSIRRDTVQIRLASPARLVPNKQFSAALVIKGIFYPALGLSPTSIRDALSHDPPADQLRTFLYAFRPDLDSRLP
jgi:hypothetical protein